jgi:C-terminal processing protease CtpA/Prc
MSGLEVISKGLELKTFEVISVLENSPAHEAGIRKGDILLSLNGKTSEDLDLNYINHFLRSREGKRIWLKLERDGEVIKKKFELKSLI